LADLVCTGASPQADGSVKQFTPHKTSAPDTWGITGPNGQFTLELDFLNDPLAINCGVCGAPMRVVKPAPPSKTVSKPVSQA
jgi:hypothetical protein